MTTLDLDRLHQALRWEQRARQLLQGLAVAGPELASVEALMQYAVDAVCRVTGWPVGHAFRRDGAELATTRVWHLDDAARFAAFRKVSEQARFGPGVGLPGRVLQRREAIWVEDVTQDPNFPRAGQADDLGVRAAFCLPVIVEGEVQAVLEFFSPDPAPPDLPLLEVLDVIGGQLARALERDRAQAAVRASELRFRSVAATATDAIIIVDGDGDVLSWNGAAERMFGWTEAEMRGQPLTNIIPPEHREGHQRGMARVRAGGERKVIGKTVELRGLRRDGSTFPLELSLAAWDSDGQAFYSGIIRDVSERHASQEKLRKIAEQLERSEQAAVEASRAKSLFLANMSHELRTPLNAILGFSQLLARDEGLSSEQRESLAVILRSGEHLLGLINDVLSISKIEAGESTLHEVDFDPQRLLSSLREMFHLRAQGRGLSLLFEIAPGFPPRVHGDEGKLRQVLINLLGNAVKFTESGGVALRARWEAGRARYAVEDTGPGIAPDELAQLFTPFVQTAAGKKAHEGTGLGLAISHDFVRLMGGELQVQSTLGKGTRFELDVVLREVRGDAPQEEDRRVLGLADGEPERRILVVDNAADNRTLLARLLVSLGFRVREAADGAQAVDAWRQWRPHFIWMDMRMPVLDGYEATRQIREATGSDEKPPVIVALTASAFEHDRASIMAAGCDEIVAKPFRERTIFEVLERRLGVRFRYETAVTAPAPHEALTEARLRAQPREWLDALKAALSDGDDLRAQREAERIREADPALAEALLASLRAFQLDELTGLVERASR